MIGFSFYDNPKNPNKAKERKYFQVYVLIWFNNGEETKHKQTKNPQYWLELNDLGTVADNQNGNLRWYLPLGVGPPPHPPLNGTYFQTFFYPTFPLLQLNPTCMKRILHLVSVKIITFKSSYNWFKIDIHQQLRPLTANYLAMFKVISTTIYT